MPKRIVKLPIQVSRGGKFVTPTVGIVFDFTSEEISDINKLNRKALGYIVKTDPPEPTTSDLPVIESGV